MLVNVSPRSHAQEEKMALNTVVRARDDAPPITRILAEFVANHPSKNWSDAVENDAHRTFINWLGCVIGASRLKPVDEALTAFKELRPFVTAKVIGSRSQTRKVSGR